MLELLIKDQVSSQLNEEYVQEIMQDFKETENIFKLYSNVCNNHVF